MVSFLRIAFNWGFSICVCIAWYDDPRNMTAHTIIATPAVWLPFEEQKQSIAQWLADAIDGNLSDYGVELIDKKYD